LLNKYLKCSVWRLALRYDIYIYVVRLLKVNGALPPGSPHSSHRQRSSVPKALLRLSKSPVNDPLPGAPTWPYGEKCPFPELSCIYFSESPINEAPLSPPVSLNGAHMENAARY